MTNFKKIFAIDLDGTLLSKTKKIKNKDIESLKKYASYGGEIVIITGKSVSSGKKHVYDLQKKIGIKLKYASFLAGSVIYDIQNDKIVNSNEINADKCQIILEGCKENKLNFIGVDFENGKDLFYLGKFNFLKWLIKLIIIKDHKHKICSHFDEYGKCYKINVYNKWFTSKKIESWINELKRNSQFFVCKTARSFYEITSNFANKGIALQTITKLLNKKIEDTASIGDSDNDVSMFNISSISFGIDNKKETFRKASKILLKHNQNNPVSYVIENYLLKQGSH